MSKGFGIALLAALVAVPITEVMSFAEESQAETKQECCDKDKGCCDKNKDCDKDCKCKDCKNADCDVANCMCEGCEKSDCKYTAIACASCDESGCQSGASSYAGCSQTDCANGKCCSELSCDALTICAGNGRCSCEEKSALRLTGQSLFAAPSSGASVVTDDMWQIIANELDDVRPCRLGLSYSQSTRPKKSGYLLLNNETGGDFAIQTNCNPDTTVSSVLREAVLPHPVNFAEAEIAVCRPRALLNDGETIEAEEQVLPVRWDQTTGQPTIDTNHALQPNDRLCVKLAAAAEGAPSTVAVESPTASAMTIRDFISQPRQKSIEENTTQIQYRIDIIEDCEGCLGEYEALRKGMPMMIAESKTLLPAMRVMQKHQLIRQLSAPKLICMAGQTAQLEIGSETAGECANEWEGVRLEVSAEEVENGLMVELAMHATEYKRRFEVRTALLVEPGQTIVLNANAAPAPEGEKQSEQGSVYVVLTPEIVK